MGWRDGRWRMDGCCSARRPSPPLAAPIAGAPAAPSEGGGTGAVAWMAQLDRGGRLAVPAMLEASAVSHLGRA